MTQEALLAAFLTGTCIFLVLAYSRVKSELVKEIKNRKAVYMLGFYDGYEAGYISVNNDKQNDSNRREKGNDSDRDG